MPRIPIADLIVHDDDPIRDAADYGGRVAALPAAQAARVMDVIDIYGAARVEFTAPTENGAIILTAPTGKMHSSERIEVVQSDGTVTDSDVVSGDTPGAIHMSARLGDDGRLHVA